MNKRLLSISEVLLKENDYITIDTIASVLNVSNKTIRNDLFVLDDIVRDFGLILDKKTGSGVVIKGDNNSKLNLITSLKNKTKLVVAYSPEDRKIFILKKLLTLDTNIKIFNLSSLLHVSSATVHKDLILVEDWLSNYKIRLIKESSLGIRIEGKEKNIRKALVDLICADKDYMYFKELLYNKQNVINDSQSIRSFDDILNIDFVKLQNIILSSKGLNLSKCSDESILTLLIHMSIAMNRIQNSKHIGLTDKSYNYLVSRKIYVHVCDLCSNISKEFDIFFPDVEIAYMLMLILILNLSQSSDCDLSSIDGDKSYLPSPNEIALNLISYWESTLNIDISQDSLLVSSLTLHLRPAIYRLRFSFPIYNPILDEIKSSYPKSFELTMSSCEIIQSYLNCSVSEHEVGYLTVHLVNAINRSKKKLKTLLVCHSSVGIYNLLHNRLQSEFYQLDITLCQSLVALHSQTLDNIDLIITTVPINLETNCDVIYINTLLSDEDLLRLNQTIKKLHSKKNKFIYPDNDLF